MNQQPAPIPAPLRAAVGNITAGTNALAASNTGNKNLMAGVNVPANLSKVNANNNKAMNAFNAGAANVNKTLKLVNTNNKRKNSLVIAQKHFTSAAINAAANQPIKAANHARRGIGALKNYIGANVANA